MSNRWEDFAKKDAEFYIYSVDVDYSTPEGLKYFFASGEKDAQKILGACGDHIGALAMAIEIGCGTGRIISAMATRFERVAGVDVSPTMLTKMKQNFQDMGLGEVATFLPQESWDDESPDLVYSYLVFQHIESMDVIEDYVRRVASCLGDGVFFAQFDTRAQSIDYRIRRLIPDPFLPKTLRRGIRRVRRNPDDLIRMFTDAGLTVVAGSGTRNAEHSFVLKRADRL